jgi:RimJ/RimL family protein N-acetyltransferase
MNIHRQTHISVRLLRPDDVETFKTIRLEALRADPAAFASTAEDWERLPEQEWRQRLTENAVFVAFHDREPVGIMGLMRERSPRRAHRATLIMVYLRNSERGSGLATALVAGVLDHARLLGVRQLELTVSADNPTAIRFYRREGFIDIGRIPAGFVHQGRDIDEIMMTRRIDG